MSHKSHPSEPAQANAGEPKLHHFQGHDPGLQIHTINLTVADGIVDVFGIVRTEAEKTAIRVAADNVVGITRLVDETSIVPVTIAAY